MRAPLLCAVITFGLTTTAPAAEPEKLSVEEVARRARRSVVTIRPTGRCDRDQGLGTGHHIRRHSPTLPQPGVA